MIGSWGGGRTERDSELSYVFIITSLLVAWMKGEGPLFDVSPLSRTLALDWTKLRNELIK